MRFSNLSLSQFEELFNEDQIDMIFDLKFEKHNNQEYTISLKSHAIFIEYNEDNFDINYILDNFSVNLWINNIGYCTYEHEIFGTKLEVLNKNPKIKNLFEFVKFVERISNLKEFL